MGQGEKTRALAGYVNFTEVIFRLGAVVSWCNFYYRSHFNHKEKNILAVRSVLLTGELYSLKGDGCLSSFIAKGNMRKRDYFSLGTKWYLSGENVHFIWTGPQMIYPFERQIKPNETQTFCRSLTDCSMCFLFSSRFLLESKSEPWDSWEESRDWLKLSNRSVTSKPKVKTRWLSDPWTAQFW